MVHGGSNRSKDKIVTAYYDDDAKKVEWDNMPPVIALPLAHCKFFIYFKLMPTLLKECQKETLDRPPNDSLIFVIITYEIYFKNPRKNITFVLQIF